MKLWRDTNGTSWSEWVTVPSLWWQLEDAAKGLGDAGGEGGTSSRYRSPGSIECLQLRTHIHDIIVSQLFARRTPPIAIAGVVNVPDSLRRLASILIVANVQVDDWASYIRHWSRQITLILGLDQHPRPRRIRDTPCPECQATHVTIDQGSGPERVPPLLIDFNDGYVRAIECTACGVGWLRQALADLSDTLIAQRPSSPSACTLTPISTAMPGGNP